MEAIQTLIYTIWEWLKVLAFMFWEIITLVPKTIGLPWWAVILVGIAIIILILMIKRKLG